MSDRKEKVRAFATTLGIATAQFQALMDRRLAAFDLTTSQLSVLSHIARHAPCRITDISRAVEVGQPAVTKMVTKFTRLGWIAPGEDRDDRRAKTVTMTQAGYQHLGQIQAGLIPDLPERLSDIPDAQLEAVTQTLRHLIGVLDTLRQLDARG